MHFKSEFLNPGPVCLSCLYVCSSDRCCPAEGFASHCLYSPLFRLQLFQVPGYEYHHQDCRICSALLQTSLRGARYLGSLRLWQIWFCIAHDEARKLYKIPASWFIVKINGNVPLPKALAYPTSPLALMCLAEVLSFAVLYLDCAPSSAVINLDCDSTTQHLLIPKAEETNHSSH